MLAFDEKYCLDCFEKLVGVDSTTGQYEEIQKLLCGLLDELGCAYRLTHKGGVIADLGGEGHGLAVTAHLDDIGLMVRHVNADGTLNVCPVGGLYPFYCVTENVRVYTRDGQVFTGAICRTPNSIHVTEEELRSVAPDFRANVCVVLDEDVKSAEQTRALGIDTGDMIALEPRYRLANGYLKSRFVDDKACVAVLLDYSYTTAKSANPAYVWVNPAEGLYGGYNMLNIIKGSKNKELAEAFIDFYLSYDVQYAEAMDGVDSPVRTDIVLDEEHAQNFTYGDMVSQLILPDWDFVTENLPAWTEQWNETFSVQ